MIELLVASFKIDGHADHEMSVFAQPDQAYKLFCSKRPGDLLSVGPRLRVDETLWVINMIRDPHDVVVSRHARAPSKYWVHLGVWKRRRGAVKRLARNPKFITVRYEDLVNDPDRVQRELEGRMPFLERTAAFSEFHKQATPSERAIEALGGVRPIETSRIGNRRHAGPRRHLLSRT
ncbi:MAG: sulfotransferase [Actinomycetota bacterium]